MVAHIAFCTKAQFTAEMVIEDAQRRSRLKSVSCRRCFKMTATLGKCPTLLKRRFETRKMTRSFDIKIIDKNTY